MQNHQWYAPPPQKVQKMLSQRGLDAPRPTNAGNLNRVVASSTMAPKPPMDADEDGVRCMAHLFFICVSSVAGNRGANMSHGTRWGLGGLL